MAKMVVTKRSPNDIKGSWADYADLGTIEQVIHAAQQQNIVPIINILANGYCGNLHDETPKIWYQQVQDLVAYLSSRGSNTVDPSKMIYFEIGNEVNGPGEYPKYTDEPRGPNKDYPVNQPGASSATGTDHFHYEDIFAWAARGLQKALAAHGFSNYRILTAGMIAPTSTTTSGMCQDMYHYDNVFMASAAVQLAHSGVLPNKGALPGPAVPWNRLGYAVHPYGYNSAIGAEWRNYYQTSTTSYITGKDPTDPAHKRLVIVSYPQTRNTWAGTCLDLPGLIGVWMHGNGRYRVTKPTDPQSRYQHTRLTYNLPVVFTEDNYLPGEYLPNVDPVTGVVQVDNKNNIQSHTINNPAAEGAYFADLFTWMYMHRCGMYFGGYCTTKIPGINTSMDAARVLIFKGMNNPDVNDGIYYGANDGLYIPALNGPGSSGTLSQRGLAKRLTLTTCPSANVRVANAGSSIVTDTEALYRDLVNANQCYSYGVYGK